MENIEKIEIIISVLLSLITFGTAIYKLVIKKTNNRKDEYYKKVLNTFIVKYKANENVNAVKFINAVVERDDDYVPKYVFYLIDSDRNEDLKKVLLNDYFDLYKNDINSLFIIGSFLGKVVFYAYFLLIFYFLGAGVGIIALSGINVILSIILGIIEGSGINILLMALWAEIKRIFFGIVCVAIGYGLMKLNFNCNTDWYSMKKKEIEKMIKNKLKECDKICDKYYI